MRTDDRVRIRKRGRVSESTAASMSLQGAFREQQRQGASFSGHERNHFWLSLGGQDFLELSGISALDHPGDSRSFALLDYDRDGYLDLVLVNANRPFVQLFRNRIGELSSAERPGFLAFRFHGGQTDRPEPETWSNRNGYGVRVRVEADEETWLAELHCGEGFAAQNSREIHLGLGDRDRVDRVWIRWPSGREQQFEDLRADHLYEIFENSDQSPQGEALIERPYRRDVVPAHDELSEPTGADPTAHLSALALDLTGPTTLRLYTTTATWCAACKRALPRLQRLRESFDTEQLALIGIPTDMNDTPAMLADYRSRYAPAYQTFTERSREQVDRVNTLTVEHLKTEALPASILTNASGRILEVFPNVPSVSDLRRWTAAIANSD